MQGCQHVGKGHAVPQHGAGAQGIEGAAEGRGFGQQQAAFLQGLAQCGHVQARGRGGVGAGLGQAGVQCGRGLVEQAAAAQGAVGLVELAARKHVNTGHVAGLRMAAQQQHFHARRGIAQQHHGGGITGRFRGGGGGGLHGGFQGGRGVGQSRKILVRIILSLKVWRVVAGPVGSATGFSRQQSGCIPWKLISKAAWPL